MRGHPKDQATLLSRFLLFWLMKFFRSTSKKLRSSKKLFSVPKSATTERYFEKLESNWEKEKTKKKPNLLFCITRTYYKEYILVLIPLTLSMTCVLVQAILVGEFINFVYNKSDIFQGILIALGFMFFTLFGGIQNDRMFILSGELAIKIRSNLNELIMKKVLKMSQIDLQDGKMTTIINILNIDLGFFMQLCMTTYLFVIPFYFTAASVILYFEIGVSGVIVHFVMLLNIPLIMLISAKLDLLKAKIGEFTKARLEWINSIVEGIKILKIFCWESVVEEKIRHLRKLEVQWHLKKSILKVISFTFVTSFQGAFILLTYWIKVKLGGSLELNQVFSGVSILTSTHFYICASVSEGIMMLKLIRIGSKKMKDLLLIPDHVPYSPYEKPQILIKSIFSSWNKQLTFEKTTENYFTSETVNFSLKDINLMLVHGKSCAVIGPVGSGKSTFLSTILKECNVFEGEVLVNGSVSYVSQDPWITQGTIRENILMGRQYDEERYNKIIEVCQLNEDFNGMVIGDKTNVGEEGKLLSQGQKARIALARGVYKECDVYLMDDPFAALDLNLIKALMQSCIFQFLKGKTLIFVTNDVDTLAMFDYIMIFNYGYLEFFGSYEDLAYDNSTINLIQNDIKKKGRKQKLKEKFFMEDRLKRRGIPLRDSQVFNGTIIGKNTYNYRISLLYNFMTLGFKNCFNLILFFAAAGGLQFFYIVDSYWLGYWSSQSESDQKSSDYPQFLLIITCIIIIGTLIRNYILYVIIFIASKAIHSKAISSILRSNMDIFYSKTPKELIDSFSGDIFQIDENLTQAITFSIMFSIMIIGYTSYIIYVIPWNSINIALFLISSSVLTYSSLKTIVLLRQHYMLSSGPLVSILKETISGISTIRSLELKKFTLSRFQRKNEKMMKKYLNFFYCLRCYTTLISLSAAFLLSINFFFVLCFIESYDASLVAVSLSFNIGIMSILPWCFRLYIEVASLLPSLNRIHSYTLLQPESKESKPDLKITAGKIEFKNVTMAYTGFKELALNNISFEVEGGKKLGIVGRSGSGKSSIFNALYQLTRLHFGKVFIDGQDLSQCDLKSMRKQISFMSQSPFVFSGSIKFNIDPEGLYSNFEVRKMLTLVGFAEIIHTSLDTEISKLELSVGQRQLLALCRVMIKDSKILLLDEATSSIDESCERTIQNIIEEYSEGKTVLTIAHKLKMLTNYDYVMLIDNGCVVDILPPNVMLTRDHSLKTSLKENADN